MKLSLSIFVFMFFSLSTLAQETSPNLLLVDSSFAPIKVEQFDLTRSNCNIISESAELAQDKGECYAVKDWQESKSYDEALLKGLMNTLSGTEGVENAKWKEFSATKPEIAKQFRNNYVLAVHGSRASYIAYLHSDKKAEILPLRVVTANTGNTKQAQSFKAKNADKLKVYSKECPLINWPKEEIIKFQSGNKLQAYQDKISDILIKNASIKVVSISLGYKKSWISEDNGKCDPTAVEKEYQVLVDSWSNLLKKFNDRVFIVAAGNEGANFDNASDKNDDLWATLEDNENLILVGSLKKSGERYPSSNYGKKVVMVKGEEIEVLSPLPSGIKGYKTTVRGTSFSAPIIAGLAIKALSEKPNIPMSELRVMLVKSASEVK